MKRIFVIAGELSGDVNTAHLVEEMKKLSEDFWIGGVGGRRMRSAGVKVLWDSTDWGSIGIFDALAKARKLLPVWREVFNHLEHNSYDLLLLVDYRYFNMKVARRFKRKFKIFYYFSPVDWRINNSPLFWKLFGLKREGGGKRYEELKECVDMCFLTFPFAVEKYEEYSIPYEYIGHPGCERVKKRAEELRFSEDVVGVFPGSREGELKRHLPVLVRACEVLKKRGERVVFSLADPVFSGIFDEHSVGRKFEVWTGDSVELMARSKLLLLSSGTVTHEATFLGKPMVVFYKVNPFLARISQWFILNLPYWSFPNIMANREVVPELMQWDFTERKVVAAAERLLEDPEAVEAQRRALKEVRERVCVDGGVSRAAERILRGAGVIP